MESLSSYARQFLGQMDNRTWTASKALSRHLHRPEDDHRNPRSTVGTVTEIYDYLRLLWAGSACRTARSAGRRSRQQTVDQIVDQLLALPEGTKLADSGAGRPRTEGEHRKIFEDARKSATSASSWTGTCSSSPRDPLDKTGNIRSRSSWTGSCAGTASSDA